MSLKFSQIRDWLKNTGAGIEENDGGISLAENFESMFACCKEMGTICGSKKKTIPLAENYMDG
ncbi:hypothetical protein VP01_2278g3, partial [Puccinia sorghi]